LRLSALNSFAVSFVLNVLTICPQSNICGIIITMRKQAITCFLIGERSKEMWNFVQNHHADSSLIFCHSDLAEYVFCMVANRVLGDKQLIGHILFGCYPRQTVPLSASRALLVFASLIILLLLLLL
jgi:hypothetical protein